MENPFMLAFGRKPTQYISRLVQTEELIDKLRSENPPSMAYMITGVRGSGKTVLMSAISSRLAEDDSWIVEELNPERDMLQNLAAKLYTRPKLKKLFLDSKLDFSALGIGISVEGGHQFFDIEVALSKMLGEIKKQGKRILITIDEVVKNKEIKIFASSFQIFIRNDLPIYLIMTGLYDNLYNLQNDKSLTFLYRTPKTYLDPLNYTAVRKSYMNVFNISMEEADKMASLVMGYPFAYQVLGYIRWEHADKNIEELMDEYDRYLDEFVYEKIWSELSDAEKSIISVIAVEEKTEVKEIRNTLKMSSEKFSVYRDRMKRKGVVDTSRYGHMTFSLPRFDIYVKNHV